MGETSERTTVSGTKSSLCKKNVKSDSPSVDAASVVLIPLGSTLDGKLISRWHVRPKTAFSFQELPRMLNAVSLRKAIRGRFLQQLEEIEVSHSGTTYSGKNLAGIAAFKRRHERSIMHKASSRNPVLNTTNLGPCGK